jgi:hypothetical protein
MGWFGNSEKSTNSDGSEICVNTGVRIDSEYTYYLGEDGNVWRKNDTDTELVAMAGVSKVDEYLYYIDTNGGNVCRIHKSGDFDKLDEAEIKSINEISPLPTSKSFNSKDNAILRAKKREEYYDYDEAIEIYEENNMPEEAARVRKLKVEQGAVKVEQTVIHGDQVTKTEIKDSVLNKSNIGAGGKSKAEEIKEIKELHDTGAIDDDEFKQMKKEILGK